MWDARVSAIMGRSARVLVAEDDPVSSKILCALLERAGYDPVPACDGQEAWNIFENEPARLVISDWMMPGLDGLGLCEKIRARAKTAYTYFILLTANDSSAPNYALATAAGVDDFLTKPLDREILRMRLRVAERILKFTAEIRQLRELITICSYCHRVRDDHDHWDLFETYVLKETGSRFSHGACPECCEKELERYRTTV